MRSVLKNFEGLYGDHQQPFADGFIHHELLEVRSRLYDWDIEEHLHAELVQVFFFTAGNGVLLAGQRRITLKPPCVLLIPANTLHGFSFESGMVGEVLTLAEAWLESLFKGSLHIPLEINRLNHFLFEGETEAFADLIRIKDQIARELAQDAFEKDLTLQTWVQLLWLRLYRISLESEILVPPSDHRTLRHFQEFQKLIRKSIHELKSVQEYARALSITTVHLNRICQSLVRKSALQLIHEALVNEARKYLLHTTYSLSEISYLLNFRDPAYFSRFFKKQTGLSPGAFRKQT